MNSFLYNTLSKYFDGFTNRHLNHSNDTLNVISLDHNKESIEYIDDYHLSKKVDLTKQSDNKSLIYDFKQRFMMFSFIQGFKLYGSFIKSGMMNDMMKNEKKPNSFNYNYV